MNEEVTKEEARKLKQSLSDFANVIDRPITAWEVVGSMVLKGCVTALCTITMAYVVEQTSNFFKQKRELRRSFPKEP